MVSVNQVVVVCAASWKPSRLLGDHDCRVGAFDQTDGRELGIIRRFATQAKERVAGHERADTEARHVLADLVHGGERHDADDPQVHGLAGECTVRSRRVEDLHRHDIADIGGDAVEGVLAEGDLVVGERRIDRAGGSA